MKKTVKFEAFGKDDYLSLDIEQMARMEQVTGDAITEISEKLAQGTFGIGKIIKVLPIALEDCREIKDIEKEISSSWENGYSILSLTIALLNAIGETGMFGNAEKLGKLKAHKAQASNQDIES